MNGEKLKQLRLKLGLKQSQLADLTGLSKAAISLLEKGDRSPSLKTAVSLSKGLGITLDEFAGIKTVNPDTARTELNKLKLKMDKIQSLCQEAL